ncbi:MAG: NCS2 family permease [Lachnospiraceae bacterium]|nr:NCS2 family permease [Lachnospiraceae bacterium]
MEHLFRLKDRNTDIKTEIVAGLTTYLSMIYVFSIIAAMMKDAGVPENAAYTSILLAAGIGSIIMGVLANYPVGLAPSLGVTVLFSSTLCGRMGYSWQAGLCAVFVEGVIFLLIAYTGVRKSIMEVIPPHLKTAISCGIGFLLTFIGLKNCGIIVSNEQNLVGLGHILTPGILVSFLGIVILLGLVLLKKPFGMVIGMAVTAVIGIIVGIFFPDANLPSINTNAAMLQASGSSFGAMVMGFKELFSSVNVLLVLFSVLFVDFFDTTGTLLAVIYRTKLPTINGEPEKLNRALTADALGSIVGAVLGAPSVSSYVESESGIESGGRTGLTAVTTGVLFIASIFLFPVFNLITSCVASPVLIIVGSMMMINFGNINWKDYSEAVSAFATVIMMILTYSIADGIAFGFIVYGLTAIFTKRYKEVAPLMWVMMGFFGLYFLMI